MRLGSAQQWNPRPGRIVQWEPAERTIIAAERAAPHPVGPSFLQRDHIFSSLAHRAAGREHRGFTCSTMHVRTELDESRMTAALTDFLNAHEGLRSSFRVDGTTITRYVVDPGDIELCSSVSEESDPHTHLAQRLPVTAVFDALPGCAFGAVTRRGSFDLYYAIDHAYGDGASQVLGLLEILARYRGEHDHPLVATDHGSYLDYVADEYIRAAQVDETSPGVVEWRRVLSRSGGVIPAFPLSLGLSSDESGPVPQDVVIHDAELADATATESLSALAKEHRTSISAVIYAALGVAQRRLSGSDWYATASVVSTRGQREHSRSQGWYCNFAPVGFEVAGDDFGAVIDAAADALARAKSAADDPVHASLGVLLAEGAIDPSVVTSPQMVTYLDFRWFPTPSQASDLLVFTGEGRTRNASVWIGRNADGLRIGTQRPDNLTAAESVSRYFATVRGVLAEALAGSGGGRLMPVEVG